MKARWGILVGIRLELLALGGMLGVQANGLPAALDGDRLQRLAEPAHLH